MTQTTIETQVKTLKESRDFWRTTPSGRRIKLTLPKGKQYLYHSEHTEEEWVHIATYVDSDGYEWMSESRKPREKKEEDKEVIKEVNEKMMETAKEELKVDEARHKRIETLDKQVKKLSGKIFRVNYYIPTRLTKKVGQRHIAIFRKHCILHDDGSNWLFTEEGVNHPEVKQVFASWDDIAPIVEDVPEMPAFKMRTEVRHSEDEVSSEQVERMREKMKKELYNLLIETHTSLIVSIDNASEELRKVREGEKEEEQEDGTITITKYVPTHKQLSVAENKHVTTLRVSLALAIERFEMCLRGAEVFDDTGSLDALKMACQESIKVRALAINAILHQNNRKAIKVPKSITSPVPPSMSNPEPR